MAGMLYPKRGCQYLEGYNPIVLCLWLCAWYLPWTWFKRMLPHVHKSIQP
jgi:hypothetical protein